MNNSFAANIFHNENNSKTYNLSQYFIISHWKKEIRILNIKKERPRINKAENIIFRILKEMKFAVEKVMIQIFKINKNWLIKKMMMQQELIIYNKKLSILIAYL